MAARKTRTRPQYRTPGVVDGNLARRLDSQELERRLEQSGQLDFDKQYRRRKETQAERLSRRRAKVKAAIRPAQKVSAAAVLGFGGVAVMMVALLLCYVRVNTISRSIVEMKTEIDALKVEQVSLLTQYEQKFDLASVKEAAEAAGMTERIRRYPIAARTAVRWTDSSPPWAGMYTQSWNIFADGKYTHC